MVWRWLRLGNERPYHGFSLEILASLQAAGAQALHDQGKTTGGLVLATILANPCYS